MKMNFNAVPAEKVFPILGVFDGVVVSRRGVLTKGWELTFPTAYTVREHDYDDMLEAFGLSISKLPEWSVVHRQDVYLYEDYRPEKKPGDGYLKTCYNEHFEGRRFLTHKSYLYVSFTGKNQVEKAGQHSGIFGINAAIDVPSRDSFSMFSIACDKFIKTLSENSAIEARELKDSDWVGEGAEVGIIQRYMMLGNGSPQMSDIGLTPDSVNVYDKTLLAYVIGESDCLPTEIESTAKVPELSSSANKVFLSFGAKLGVLLDCEHVINQIIVIPPQASTIKKLEKERNKMSSGIDATDNRLNSEEISDFLDDAYKLGLYTVKSHVNVLAWGSPAERMKISASISSALSSMKINAVYNNFNTPILYYAGIPSNGFEIGKENLMLMELNSALTLLPYETFDSGIPGGMMQICDRMRHVPLNIDTQAVAQARSLIGNFNMFILGGSGTGKSFFTNFYLRNCYDAGESVFVIDVGDSYEGLCAVIREESGGKDGAYLSWDAEHPFSFNPFLDIDSWPNGTGGLNTSEAGVNFFLSFLLTAWEPDGGWDSSNKVILTQFIIDFLGYVRDRGITEPIFDDFYQFIDRYVTPKVLYQADEQSADGTPRSKEAIDADYRPNGYFVGSVHVTKKLLDIEKFVLSLKNYSLSGSYSFLLNEKHPKDLFTSRFTVFEVDKLSQDDTKFYSLCILCIMSAFDRKMRAVDIDRQNSDKRSEMKNIVIEEAWKAISTDTMADYLRALWKTARKFNTSAVVVTQEIADIVNSEKIKTAILDNSDVKILLDQSNHLNTFDDLQGMLSLTDHEKNLILSMNRCLDDRYRYKEVYINLGGKRSFVAATEVSPQEAVAYESAKDKKQPFLNLSRELGSAIKAIDILTKRVKA